MANGVNGDLIPRVAAVCPQCGAEQIVEYVLLGATTPCAHYAAPVVLQRVRGRPLPNTWFAMTFTAFRRLVAYRDPESPLPDLRLGSRRAQVQEVLERLGFRMEGDGDDARIVDASGTEVDPLAVHRAVQSDRQLQFQLYQIDMDISHQGW